MSSMNIPGGIHYRERGDGFFDSMGVLADDPKCGNAAALLAVHGSISFTDAVRMWYTGACSGERHNEAVDALRKICENQNKNVNGCNHLRWLLNKKSKISYGAERLRIDDDIKSAISHAERFRSWMFKSFREVFQDAQDAKEQ